MISSRSSGSKICNQPNCMIIVHEITEVYCPVLSLSHPAVYDVIGLHKGTAGSCTSHGQWPVYM